MKHLILTLLASASLTSCAAITKEIRHPGGYPGYLLDKRMFDASHSKQLQLYRATLITAMAARMGTATIKNGKDGDAFADYLVAATDEINYAAANLYDSTESYSERNICLVSESNKVDRAETSKKCGGYYTLFESDMPLVEGRIVRLMLAALPEDRAKDFLEDVSKGSIIAAAWEASKAFLETTGGLHRSAGVYRSGIEGLVANDVKDTTTSCYDQPNNKYSEDSGTILQAAKCLGLDENKIGYHPHERKGEELTKTVSWKTFEAMMFIMKTSCASLPLTFGTEIETSVNARNTQCNNIRFEPTPRPSNLKL